MNIVYGVSGEGLGHVFEAIEIIRLLERDGHAVKVLTFGDRALRALDPFRPTPIEGIHLFMNAQGLSLWQTFRGNLPFFSFFPRNTGRLLRELAAFRPDVFLTAYEPFTTFAAHQLRKPLISMDNQNELRFLPRPPGASPVAFYLVCLANRVVNHGATHSIVKSFHRRIVRNPRIHVVPPLIQSEIRALRPTGGPHILVYLTKPNPHAIEVLKTITEETFIVYCRNRVGQEGNLTFRAQGPSFLPDLASCMAIIGTTGFSLIADAIYLKKPYYGVPLKRQFEQTNNAAFLTHSGMGDSSETMTPEKIRHFLTRLPLYRQNLAQYNLDPHQQQETLRSLLTRLTPRASAKLPSPIN